MRLGADSDDLSNVEDRRGTRTGVKLGVGGVLLLGVLSLVFRRNLFEVVQQDAPVQLQPGAAVEQRKAAEMELQRVAVGSFNDAQRAWKRHLGDRWRDAKLVLFWDEIQSGCGGAGSAMGPFYCPSDERVYLDLGFYQELAGRFGASGDFAQAYVIAHEVGHHVQNLLGISERVSAQQRRTPQASKALSVRLELQADCFAGVWGRDAAQRNVLDPGDTDEGLHAASAVGDDRMQRMAGQRVSPDSFTHGSSADRAEAFRRGLAAGSIDACDTFRAP